jgi:hypothetical protein
VEKNLKNNLLDRSVNQNYSKKVWIFFLGVNILLIVAELLSTIAFRVGLFIIPLFLVWLAVFDAAILVWAIVTIHYGKKLGEFFRASEKLKDKGIHVRFLQS